MCAATGEAKWSSSSRALATPSASEMSGGSRTCVTRMAVVSVRARLNHCRRGRILGKRSLYAVSFTQMAEQGKLMKSDNQTGVLRPDKCQPR